MTDPIEIMARAIYYATPRNKPLELLGQHARQYEKQARAALSALHEAGFVVVPKEPTREMIGAGGLASFKSDLATGLNEREGLVAAYRAMIAAAQVPHDKA